MNPEELLKEGLNRIGFSCSEGQINAFMIFLSELKKWNTAYNLTSLRTDKDIIIKHFLDSLLYLKAIGKTMENENSRGILPRSSGWKPDLFSYKHIKLADVGTGAGFPGIPLKIINPRIDITLIESSWKKSAFLRHIIRVLKLKRINVLNKRIETLGESHEKTYDIIVSRATFKIKDFLKKACPYIKENGQLVLSKGPGVPVEIGKLKNKYLTKKIIRLPFINAERTLLIIKC